MGSKNIKILIIDDLNDNLISIKAQISDLFTNATVLTTANGRQGLDIAASEDPDVIILDIVMPEMDGFEVCQQLKSHPLLKDIPVVFLTASRGDRESRIRALEVGAEAFLQKPVDETELTALLKAMVKVKAANMTERTEIKQLQQTVQEQGRELEVYFNSSLDLLCIANTKGEFVRLNPEWENVLGYPLEELEGRRFLDFIHPGDLDSTIKAISILESQEELRSFENRYRCKDGSYRWIEWRSKPSGEKVYAVARDVTSRKNTEAAIRKSEIMLQEAGRLAKLGGWEFDPSTNLVIWTEQTYLIHEVEPGFQPKLDNGLSFYTPEALPVIQNALHEAMENGSPFDLELPLITAKGRRIWVRVIGRSEQEQGKTVRLFGVVQDISERKWINELIRENERRLHEVIESNFDGMLVVDQDGMVLMNNPAAATMLNIASDQITGSPFGLPVSVDESSELEVINPDGSLKTLEMRFNSIKWINNPAFIISLRDVTHRIKIAREIEQKNEELLKTNNEKDKFFSIVAHDLRSPFNAIMGFSELLKEQIKENDLEGIANYADLILKSSNRAMNLLTNLMEWSQAHTGRMVFAPELFDINRLIQDTMMLFSDAAGQKSIEIQSRLPESLPVFADKSMISTVLRNLVSNAIKFSKPGSFITLAAEIKPGECIISVEDQGVGIPPETMKKLFGIGENYSTPGTQNEKGTGLGLILCREFVEKHKGIIRAESKPGKGSTFYFTIPATSESLPTSKEVKEPVKTKIMNETKKLNILIAEDDQTSEMFFEIAVRSFAGKIFKTKNGKEAVNVCRQNPDLDLILMDIMMPEINGYEATRQIREFNKEIIIVAQTAFDRGDGEEDAIAAGCNDIIMKPMDRTDLLKMIRKYFEI